MKGFRDFKTIKEVASSLNVTEGTVESMMERGMVSVRANLKSGGHDYYVDQKYYEMRDNLIEEDDLPALFIRPLANAKPIESPFLVGINKDGKEYLETMFFKVSQKMIEKAIGLPVLFVYSHFVLYGGILEGISDRQAIGNLGLHSSLLVSEFDEEQSNRYVGKYLINNVSGAQARFITPDKLESDLDLTVDRSVLPFFCNKEGSSAYEATRKQVIEYVRSALYFKKEMTRDDVESTVSQIHSDFEVSTPSLKDLLDESFIDFIVSSVMSESGRYGDPERVLVSTGDAIRRITTLVVHLLLCRKLTVSIESWNSNSCGNDIVKASDYFKFERTRGFRNGSIKVDLEIEEDASLKNELMLSVSYEKDGLNDDDC